MEELWLPVSDFPAYEVSSLGRVRGRRVPFLKQTNRDLYLEVHLGRNNLRRVHRLVAEAFLPRQEGRDYVDHINRVKTDNRLENLRWATCGENHMNKDAQSNSQSGHKNIHWKPDKGKWRVEIQGLHRGYYPTLDEAIAARKSFLGS